MQNLIEEPISADVNEALLIAIKEKKWWQGSVIPASSLGLEDQSDANYWVIASQACNIYNPNFEKVSVFELVAARQIDECDPKMTKGDNPRILHLVARSQDDIIALELDIQERRWLSRSLLAQIPRSTIYIRDAKRDEGPDWNKNLWLDNFIGWMARSYTRVAFPDEFNDSMRASRIEEVLKEKITKHQDKLYGIYLLVSADADDEWHGILGEMPPPYLLEIMLITYEDFDPEEIKKELIQRLFIDSIQDPKEKSQKVTRGQLARRHNIHIIESSIDARTISGINLLELKSLVRYTFVDHLSDSSMAV